MSEDKPLGGSGVNGVSFEAIKPLMDRIERAEHMLEDALRCLEDVKKQGEATMREVQNSGRSHISLVLKYMLPLPVVIVGLVAVICGIVLRSSCEGTLEVVQNIAIVGVGGALALAGAYFVSREL